MRGCNNRIKMWNSNDKKQEGWKNNDEVVMQRNNAQNKTKIKEAKKNLAFHNHKTSSLFTFHNHYNNKNVNEKWKCVKLSSTPWGFL